MAARLSRLISRIPLLIALGLWPWERAAAQTASAAEIRRAGIFRLGELLRLGDRWDRVTVDEYVWRGAPASTPALEDDAWAVLVDGLPLDPGLLGVTALERLPLDLGAIDSLEFGEAPRLASGILADRGMLRLRTVRPARGLSARGRYATGAETGDPGPFEFVPPGRRNRDRYGHDASLGAAYGGKRWYLAAGLGLGVHILTDPAIADRQQASGRLRIERAAPSLRLGLDRWGGAHKLLLGRSRLDDSFRLEAFGAELPVRSTFGYAGVTGTFPLGSSELRYRLAGEAAEVRSLVGAIERALDFERRSLRAEIEMAFGASSRDLIGLGVWHRKVRTPYALNDDPILGFRSFGSVGWRPATSISQRLSLALDIGAGAAGAGVILEQEWRAGPRDAVSLVLSASRPLREDDEGLYALTARGYGWLAEAGIPVSFEGDDDAPRAASVHAAWRRVLARGLALRLSGFYQAFTADYLARRELSFDSERLAWRGPVRLLSGRRGEAGGLQVEADGRLNSRLGARVSYRLRRVISGGGPIEDAWDRVPQHTARLYLAYTPVPGLELWGGLWYRGGTRWADYANTSLDATTPRVLSLDVSVQKELWHRRLRASLALRNLFNSPLRFHPEGATAGRAATLTVETMFPGRRDGRSRPRSSAEARGGEATGHPLTPPRSAPCCECPRAGCPR